MPQLTGGQFLCLLIVLALVAGSVSVAWAKAFAARKTGKWPDDSDKY